MGFFDKLVDSSSGLDPQEPLNPIIADLPVGDGLKRAAMASLKPGELVYDGMTCVCNDKYGSIKSGWIVLVTQARLIMGNKQLVSVPWGSVGAFGLASNNPGLVLEIAGSNPTLNGKWLFLPILPGLYDKGVSEGERETRQQDRSRLLGSSMNEAFQAFTANESERSSAAVEDMAAELRRKRGF